MSTPNLTLMQNARKSLSNKWGIAIGVFFVYLLISGLLSVRIDGNSSSIINLLKFIMQLIIMGPLTLGAAIFSLNLARDTNPEFNDLFEGFKNIGNAVAAYLLIFIYTVLWSLLLIVPGIIAAISYAMTYYIMAEDQTITANDAIEKSKVMMYGYKMKYFRMCLRFFGWGLLCILTLGLGFLVLMPYIYTSMAKFYDDIKDNPIIEL